MSKRIRISSYTTTRNALEMDYPLEESILSMCSFSDEVCIFDTSDKNDGTLDLLRDLEAKNKSVKVMHTDAFDWTAPNHGIFDGMTKQEARSMCRGSYLFQFDIDEIVHENHAALIPGIIDKVGNGWSSNPILAMPVVEFWGKAGKIRIDVNVWKPRLSLNSPNIVHGIPMELRTTDPLSGLPYAKPGTDTCDYINRVTGEPFKFIHFMNEEIHALQQMARKDPFAAKEFQNWFDSTITVIPGVFHYSWYDIERKIKQYRLFWTSFWKAMYNLERDEKQNPFFPGLLWSEVTDDMIKTKAKELEESTGGWVFHKPWDGSSVNSINVSMAHPQIMQKWLGVH